MEKVAKPKDVVTLDVETNVQTTEGRIFLHQLNAVSHVLQPKDTKVEFKGEQVFKSGYIGEFKSVVLYKCPKGYFLFGDKVFGNNNVSWIGGDLDELLSKVSDKEIIQKIQDECAAALEAA